MRIRKRIRSVEEINEQKLVLTSSALLTFLASIEELDGQELGIQESESELVVTIGDNVYVLESPASSEIEINVDAIDEIDEINQEGYDEYEEEFGNLEDTEPVEGGILKEIAKTLLVGGLVRLTKNAIQKM